MGSGPISGEEAIRRGQRHGGREWARGIVRCDHLAVDERKEAGEGCIEPEAWRGLGKAAGDNNKAIADRLHGRSIDEDIAGQAVEGKI
ncbi:MAG TPA: hypothetical protein DEU95_14370, partial [Chloroflexi bacterium]|nr:hypothetical protein [Chloroflexota bacterium]